MPQPRQLQYHILGFETGHNGCLELLVLRYRFQINTTWEDDWDTQLVSTFNGSPEFPLWLCHDQAHLHIERILWRILKIQIRIHRLHEFRNKRRFRWYPASQSFLSFDIQKYTKNKRCISITRRDNFAIFGRTYLNRSWFELSWQKSK